MKKNEAAVMLGKLGGSARGKALPAARRSEIARQASQARWDKKKQNSTPVTVDTTEDVTFRSIRTA